MARTNKSRAPALAYYRTSSAANVGTDKDSEKRQRQAIESFAKRGGFELVAEFYDAAVSGADPIQDRPGFAALLDRIEDNGVRTVLVEDASRFARELMAQELGITLLINRGVRLLTASGDDLTASDDPSRKMMRQIAGAFAEYEKARLVHKLRHAGSGSGGNGASVRAGRHTQNCTPTSLRWPRSFAGRAPRPASASATARSAPSSKRPVSSTNAVSRTTRRASRRWSTREADLKAEAISSAGA